MCKGVDELPNISSRYGVLMKYLISEFISSRYGV